MTSASHRSPSTKIVAWRGGDLDALFETTFRTIRDGDPLPPCLKPPLLCRSRLQHTAPLRHTTAS
jgi:hypothetical protein